jgi:UDP-sugar transporter A1/2/3
MSKKPMAGGGGNIKAVVLCVLVLQNSALVIMLRYSRLVSTELYLPSTVVLLGELLKLVVSTAMLYAENGRSIQATQRMITAYVFHRPMDIVKISVPALLYLVQNNLTFVAISNMDSATYQVLYQLKIFTTAIMSVLLLNKKLTLQHWFALVMLFVGVVMVQLSSSPSTSAAATSSLPASSRSLEDSANRYGNKLCRAVTLCKARHPGLYVE